MTLLYAQPPAAGAAAPEDPLWSQEVPTLLVRPLWPLGGPCWLPRHQSGPHRPQVGTPSGVLEINTRSYEVAQAFEVGLGGGETWEPARHLAVSAAG